MPAGAEVTKGQRSFRSKVVAGGAGGVAILLVALAVGLFGASASPTTGRKPVVRPAPLVNPYPGVGAWVDMYAWSQTFSPAGPTFGLANVDAMANAGVQTLYIQAASQTGPAAVLEPALLGPLLARAHQDRMAVVVWYQPVLANIADDLTRLLAIAALPAEGVAVDIEATTVADVTARNTALVTLSTNLRHALPGRFLGAIVLPATLLEVVNTKYWPGFPYAGLAPSYDAWLPMVYWTNRLRSSGLRSGLTYTADSVKRLRADLGATGATVAVSPIGGISVDGIAPADVAGFATAIKQTAAVGGSLYEWSNTVPADWEALRALRR